MNTMWNNLLQAVSTQNCLTMNNPVITGINSGTIPAQNGVQILQQYFYLVATIVQFLTTAMVRIPSQRVKDELRRNIEEELGSRNNGISHQEMLERRLMQELGINVRACFNKATGQFIAEIWSSLHLQSPHYVAGTIYALEATAKSELIVVAHIVNLASQRQVINIASLTDGSVATDDTLEGFIAMHTKDFEIGHESGLRETLEEFIITDIEEFRDGFYQVLSLMQVWWNNLAEEAK
jgi:hypothetical protein